jgi:hypothetical protein
LVNVDVVSADVLWLVTASPTKAPPLASPLLVTLWHSELNRPGVWTLVLRDPKGKDISSYPFSVPK